MYIYISLNKVCIYIEREREYTGGLDPHDPDRFRHECVSGAAVAPPVRRGPTHMYVYIYIYIYTHTCNTYVCVYIYIYIERESVLV